MSTSPLHRFRALVPALLVTVVALAGSRAFANPVPGFTEDFSDGTTTSWGGGSLASNPGTGGFGGSGDGYLLVETLTAGNLGTVSFGAEYAGNWALAGVNQVRVRVKDIGGGGNLDIHLGLGTQLNFWQQNAGIVPSSANWTEYVVDLVAGDFTQTRGSGTFATMLANVDRLHFRHDLAPYVAAPDLVAGSLGLDHLVLVNANTGVEPTAGMRPVLLDPPFPNPARGRVTFSLRQMDARPVTLSILDAAGRRVRQIELAGSGGAPRLWLWDGTDDAGRALPAGVYKAIARGEAGGMSRTVTLLR